MRTLKSFDMELQMTHDDGGYNGMACGTVHSINVGRRGIEINVIPIDNQSTLPKDRPYLTCRLDRSSMHTTAMLKMATAAMLNNLKVKLLGAGDDRDDSFEYYEVRIFAKN